jgi:LmbE family N-acetylglucosaminyl deacetylase
MSGDRKSAVVVAHPDDECLWLSSVVAAADRVVFCFGDQFEKPDMAARRRHAVAALPLPNLIDLKLPESGGGFSVDWANAWETPTGIDIADAEVRARYDANYPRLVDALRTVLAGCSEVYTHNPWGEYGHAEHIQVYRAVAALQAALGYTIWFSNYVDSPSWPLAGRIGGRPSWAESRAVSPDMVTARALMGVYRRHGAWTWTRWHRWPPRETLYAQPAVETREGWRTLVGETLLDVAGLRWWPPPWRAARRYLG